MNKNNDEPQRVCDSCFGIHTSNKTSVSNLLAAFTSDCETSSCNVQSMGVASSSRRMSRESAVDRSSVKSFFTRRSMIFSNWAARGSFKDERYQETHDEVRKISTIGPIPVRHASIGESISPVSPPSYYIRPPVIPIIRKSLLKNPNFKGLENTPPLSFTEIERQSNNFSVKGMHEMLKGYYK